MTHNRGRTETDLQAEACQLASECEAQSVNAARLSEIIGERFLSLARNKTQSKMEDGDNAAADKLSLMASLSVFSPVLHPDTGDTFNKDVYRLYENFRKEMIDQHESGFEKKGRLEHGFKDNQERFLLIVCSVEIRGKAHQVPVAYIHFFLDEEMSSCYIHHLYVASKACFSGDSRFPGIRYVGEKGFNGLDLGMVLMQTVQVYALAAKGARHFFLYVSPNGGRAVEIYKRMGYRDVVEGEGANDIRSTRSAPPKPERSEDERRADRKILDLVVQVEGRRINDPAFNLKQLQEDIIQHDGDHVFYRHEASSVSNCVSSAMHMIIGVPQSAKTVAQPQEGGKVGGRGHSTRIVSRQNKMRKTGAFFVCMVCAKPIFDLSNFKGGDLLCKTFQTSTRIF